MAEIKTVGVIGAGQMGTGIAHVTALGGYTVLIHDAAEQRAEQGLDAISRNLARQAAKGQIEDVAIDKAMGRIRLVSLEEVSQADLVIEAATEDEEVKKAVFQSLKPHLRPETLLASN